ncbi:MAG: FHA domain-containing protein [Planctomycetes bacterium]|nr:FHA domain-containing protein [Planctomycetota bacterium]
MAGKRSTYRLVGPARDYVLKPGLNVVGRYLYCQVHIDAEDVAGEHATVELDDAGGVSIAPAKNAPVFLNGRPVEGKAPLQSGDSIQIGETFLTLLKREPTVTISMVRRSPKWRSFFRRLLLMLLLLVLALGALYGFASILVSPGWMAGQIEEYLSSRLQRDVQVSEVEMDLVGFRTCCGIIEIRDSAEFDMATAATLYGVDIHLENPASYVLPFLGEPKYNVEIREASLVIRKNGKGKYNVTDLVDEVVGVIGGEGISAPPLSVSLNRGSLVYEDSGHEPVAGELSRFEMSFIDELFTVLWEVDTETGPSVNGQVSRLPGGTGWVRLEVGRAPQWMVPEGLVPDGLYWSEAGGSFSMRISVDDGLGKVLFSGMAKDVEVARGVFHRKLGSVGVAASGDVDRGHRVVKGVINLSGNTLNAEVTLDADFVNRYFSSTARGKMRVADVPDVFVEFDENLCSKEKSLDIAGNAVFRSDAGDLSIEHEIGIWPNHIVVSKLALTGLITCRMQKNDVLLGWGGGSLSMPFSGLDVEALRKLPLPVSFCVPGSGDVSSDGIVKIAVSKDKQVALSLDSSDGGWSSTVWVRPESREAGARLSGSDGTLTAKGKLTERGWEAVFEGSDSLRRMLALACMGISRLNPDTVEGSGRISLTLGKISVDDKATVLAAGGKAKVLGVKLPGIWPDMLTDEASFVVNARIPHDRHEPPTFSSLKWQGVQLSLDMEGATGKDGRLENVSGTFRCGLDSNPEFGSMVRDRLHVRTAGALFDVKFRTVDADETRGISVSGPLTTGKSSIAIDALFADAAGLFGFNPTSYKLSGSVWSEDLMLPEPVQGKFKGPVKIELQGASDDGKPSLAGELNITETAVAAGSIGKQAGVPASVAFQTTAWDGMSRAAGVKITVVGKTLGPLSAEGNVAVLPTSVTIAKGGKLDTDGRMWMQLVQNPVRMFETTGGSYITVLKEPWIVFPAAAPGTLFAGVSVDTTLWGVQGVLHVAQGQDLRITRADGRVVWNKTSGRVKLDVFSADWIEAGTFNAELGVSAKEPAGLDVRSMEMGIVKAAAPRMLFGMLAGVREAWQISGDVGISGIENIAPCFSKARAVYRKKQWEVTGVGALGEYSGQASAGAAEGETRLVGRWTVGGGVTVGAVLPGWPFGNVKSIDMESTVFDGGRFVAKYYPITPALPADLFAVAGMDAAGWDYTEKAVYIEYAGDAPVALGMELKRKEGESVVFVSEANSMKLRYSVSGGSTTETLLQWDRKWTRGRSGTVTETEQGEEHDEGGKPDV